MMMTIRIKGLEDFEADESGRKAKSRTAVLSSEADEEVIPEAEAGNECLPLMCCYECACIMCMCVNESIGAMSPYHPQRKPRQLGAPQRHTILVCSSSPQGAALVSPYI